MARIGDPGFLRKLQGIILSRDPIGLPDEVDERLLIAVTIPGELVLSQITPSRVEIAAGLMTLEQSDLWLHGGSRTSGAGGAGQFSGVGDVYQPTAATRRINKLQIVALRVVPSVAAILRLRYDTVDIFGAEGDLGNSVDNSRSVTDASPADQAFGFLDWTSQTATPDTTNLVNHSGATTRIALFALRANEAYTWPLAGIANLFNRTLDVNTQARSMGWGVWATAAVTAITVDYQVLVRKTALPAAA